MSATSLEQPKTKMPEFTTIEQAEVYDRMWDKKYIRVDPKTKEPHEASKEFFWMIVGQYPAFLGSGNESAYRTTFEVQKYHRNQTYKAKSAPDSRAPEIIKHVPFQLKNSHGDMLDTGTMQIDAGKFIEQFKEDTTI